jgi:arginyl-tRNA synthetase
MATSYVAAPEANGCRCSAKTVAAMLDLIKHDLGLLGIHHDCSRPRPSCRRRARSIEAMDVLRAKGLVYEGVLERPKSLDRTTSGSRSS